MICIPKESVEGPCGIHPTLDMVINFSTSRKMSQESHLSFSLVDAGLDFNIIIEFRGDKCS